jgi:hypothetical protein
MAPVAADRYQAYLEAVRARVCAVCLDRRDDGTCGLARGRECALEAYLPEIVDTVLAVNSTRMDEYMQAIEARICSKCRSRGAAEECPFRDKGQCALWTYLPLAVDAVEE